MSEVALSRTSVIFRIGLRRQFNVGSSREPCRRGRPVPVSGRSLEGWTRVVFEGRVEKVDS